MRKQKFFATGLAAALVLSLAACGSSEGGATVTATPTPGEVANVTATATPAPTTAPAALKEVSVNFEDGQYGFTAIYSKPALADAGTAISVAEFNGSKALKITKADAKSRPYVALDISGLLGSNVGKVASIELSMGISYEDGSFSSVAGDLEAWIGADLVSNVQEWSVYTARKNPNTVTYTLPAGTAFTADNNILIISMKTDNGAAAHGNATIYVDDIRFLDASGNLLTADSSVAFTAPAGFENTGHDPNLLYVSNEVELPGYQISGGAWSQVGVDWTDEMKALLVPGSVITINYNAATPIWFVATGDNPLGGWLRAVDQNTFIPDGYQSADGSVIQYTYEQLAAYLGEGFEQYIAQLQCEAQSDWEVFGISVGTRSNYVELGSATEVPGYQISGGAWSQAGVDWTDEMKALLVPGSVIEISYSADTPIWFVATGDNPLGGWLRAVDQNTFIPDGAVSPDGSAIQYTYEQLAAYLGEGFEQYIAQLQCEAQSDWEVFGIKIGKPVYPTHGNVAIEGFTTSAGGWTQAGVALTEDVRALMVPGSVFTINYNAASPVWFVGIGTIGWSRAVNQETFVVDGAVFNDGASVQYTYEQLAAYWGENFAEILDGELQCESRDEWEVYSVTIGQR